MTKNDTTGKGVCVEGMGGKGGVEWGEAEEKK